jgi:uncharacterized protein YjiS (DUF1127 family)
MHRLSRNEAAADENAALSLPAGTVSTHDITNSDVIVDAQYKPRRWRRFINALYQARMWSAQRETERHADMILFWRRGLAERGGHLRAVAHPGTTVGKDDVVYHTSACVIQELATEVDGVFTRVRAMMAQWRRRSRVRRELLALSDSDLRDIRWTRAEAEAENRKPFWQP